MWVTMEEWEATSRMKTGVCTIEARICYVSPIVPLGFVFLFFVFGFVYLAAYVEGQTGAFGNAVKPYSQKGGCLLVTAATRLRSIDREERATDRKTELKPMIGRLLFPIFQVWL